MTRASMYERGFTLLELLISTAIFMVICAAMFSLLELSQQKYSSETQMSGAFSEARLAMDQIVRDINISGYPSKGIFSNPIDSTTYAASPFAWGPGYLSNPDCHFVGTPACSTSPSDTDLIVETNLGSPGSGSSVSWIHYQLTQNTNGQTWTLSRGVLQKTTGTDPASPGTWTNAMAPLVNNVIYNPTGALLTQITTDYPNILPGGVQPPLFAYYCSTPSGSQPCSSAPNAYSMTHSISDVDITLVVMTPYADMQTQSLKLMELTGRGHRSTFGN
jgi:prepilin-type N-terminal cleavage/methylation domain-containing protein